MQPTAGLGSTFCKSHVSTSIPDREGAPSHCRAWWRPFEIQRRLVTCSFLSDGHNFSTRSNGRVSGCPRAGTEETIVDERWCSAPVAADGSTATSSKWIAEWGSKGWAERREVGVCKKGRRHRAGHNGDDGEAGETCAM